MNEDFINSITNISIFVGIVLLTVLIGFIVNRFFKRLVNNSTLEMKNDPTNYLFMRHMITALVYVIGFSIAIYAMPNLRALAGSLLAGAGILAVSIGFASQHALSNIISGFFIVVFKPFRVNDRIRLHDMSGIIEDITLRHTVIRDFENRRIIIPNAVISNEIIVNSDIGDVKICKWIDIGISYDSDIKKAKDIIRKEIEGHPLHIDPLTKQDKENGLEAIPIKVIGLGESAVNLRAWAWAKDSADGFNMSCDVLESIKLKFDEAGIEIPFPHRTIIHKQNGQEFKESKA